MNGSRAAFRGAEKIALEKLARPSDVKERGANYAALFCFATFAACFPSAVRVRFGKWAMVRLRFAAAAAFLILRRAAARCFELAMMRDWMAQGRWLFSNFPRTELLHAALRSLR